VRTKRSSAAAQAAPLNARPASEDAELDGVPHQFDVDAARAKATGTTHDSWRPKLTAARKGRACQRQATGVAARHRVALKFSELKLGAWNC
jgi:hypothetical protein